MMKMIKITVLCAVSLLGLFQQVRAAESAPLVVDIRQASSNEVVSELLKNNKLLKGAKASDFKMPALFEMRNTSSHDLFVVINPRFLTTIHFTANQAGIKMRPIGLIASVELDEIRIKAGETIRWPIDLSPYLEILSPGTYQVDYTGVTPYRREERGYSGIEMPISGSFPMVWPLPTSEGPEN
jgi:hypothetical protein